MTLMLTTADIDRIAGLAHLELTPEERELYTRQIAEILAYAEQVREVDTTGVPPTTHALAPTMRLRADERCPSLDPRESVANAPEAARGAGLFKVPRVIGA
ncbi:MAG: Asp-tRNA(Asn)/Glu-tRNA(Gln) amidotransferase subunit GatC [Luteitalea sp.]|nr:Asp-tRNA(Asn)/Glu-tRNA(Gln) amidotransferase subunit GatC [Luteitalea sp.]